MAEAPARRFLTEFEDSRRWRNVVRRRGDVIVAAPPSGAAVVLRRVITDLLDATGPVPRPDTDGHWVDDIAIPLSVLVEELERLPGRRCFVTRSPGDSVPFDERCCYVTMYGGWPEPEHTPAVGAAPTLDAWLGATNELDHLRSWWDRRHKSNVVLLHAVDVRVDPGSAIRSLARSLQLSLSSATFDHGVARLGDLPPPRETSEPTGSAAGPLERWLAGGDRALGCRPEAIGQEATGPATGGFHPVYGRLRKAQASNTIDAITDRRVEEARRAGLFDDLALYGKPIPDIDRRRKPGWWADNFVAAEKQKVRRLELEEQLQSAMPALWRQPDAIGVRRRVEQLNTTITEFNRRAGSARHPLLDPEAILVTWHRLRSTSITSDTAGRRALRPET